MGDAADDAYDMALNWPYQEWENEENLMQGQIQAARKSKSGKNLSVQVGGNWYVSKNWEFEQMVGQEITFEPATQQFPDGGSITWINEYNATGQSTTPSGQAFDQAHAQNQPPPMGQELVNHAADQGAERARYQPPQSAPTAPSPQPSVVDKESSIVAQALTKAVTCANADEAWQTYVYLYNKVLNWNPGDFDDSVPF